MALICKLVIFILSFETLEMHVNNSCRFSIRRDRHEVVSSHLVNTKNLAPTISFYQYLDKVFKMYLHAQAENQI